MRYLIFTLLMGCSLSHGQFKKPVVFEDINIVNKTVCNESIERAKAYLLSHGVELKENFAASKSLLCISSPNLLIRSISPMYFAGLSDGKVAWALDDEKTILHELGHLLWELPHSSSGIMFPVDTFSGFATGFTDDELEKIRKEYE